MLQVIDRKSGKKVEEKVYYEGLLRFFYGNSRLGSSLARITAKTFFSKLFGYLQSRPSSKRKIAPFVAKYQVDLSSFQKKLEEFTSFNDFFTRKLKPGARPLAKAAAIMPADGRYLFYQDVDQADGFGIKGEKFSLETLLGSATLAERYQGGALIIARLNPTDYHRFHFPCSCTPTPTRFIGGPLYSVNPIALAQNLARFAKNKRAITTLQSDDFGQLLFIEVGATNVGSINQTFTPGKHYQKADEKGFFAFGGSAVVLLFEKNKIVIDQDLLKNSAQHIETLCFMGESLGS